MPVSDYTPTVAQVAANIMSRTRDKYGTLAGTFNANTTPTDTQTTAIVGAIMTGVADKIGDDIPAALFDDATRVAALRAAMQVELDFFSEQVNTGRSIYPQLKELYEQALASLEVQIVENMGAGAVSTAEAKRPSYSFPENDGLWMTRRW